MKKYTKPEVEFKLFETEDLITTSSTEVGRELTKIVNNNVGTNYGSQEVSIFE